MCGGSEGGRVPLGNGSWPRRLSQGGLWARGHVWVCPQPWVEFGQAGMGKGGPGTSFPLLYFHTKMDPQVFFK